MSCSDASMDSFDLVTGGEEAAAQVEERLRIQKRSQLPVIDPNSQPEDLRAMMSDLQDCISNPRMPRPRAEPRGRVGGEVAIDMTPAKEASAPKTTGKGKSQRACTLRRASTLAGRPRPRCYIPPRGRAGLGAGAHQLHGGI